MSDGEAKRMTDPAPQWSDSKDVAGLKGRLSGSPHRGRCSLSLKKPAQIGAGR